MLSDAAFASVLTSSFRASFLLPQLLPTPVKSDPQAGARLAADKQRQQDGDRNAAAQLQQQKDARSRLDAQARIADRLVSQALSAQVAASNIEFKAPSPSELSPAPRETLATAQTAVAAEPQNGRSEAVPSTVGKVSPPLSPAPRSAAIRESQRVIPQDLTAYAKLALPVLTTQQQSVAVVPTNSVVTQYYQRAEVSVAQNAAASSSTPVQSVSTFA